MRLDTTQPFGVSIDDIELREIDSDGRECIRSLLADHGVVVIPAQGFDDTDFVTFLAGFGPLAFTAGETAVSGHPALNVVTNAGRHEPPTSNWHVDTAYTDDPPSYTALRAVEVPDVGGATLFTNQYRALESLPAGLRDEIDGRSMRHVVTGVDPGPGEQTSAVHPLVRPHPRTGRRVLWLDAPARCSDVTGLDRAASADLTSRLLAHSTTDEAIWRHQWATDDVVIWDNAVVLHRADHSDVVGTRTFHRGMIAASGYWPSSQENEAADENDSRGPRTT